MRTYENKKNRQRGAYCSDRFKIPSQLPRFSPSTDEIFSEDVENLKTRVDVKEAYIEAGQLVVWIDAQDNVKTLEFLKNELLYNNLTDISAVDFLAVRGEFELFYQMLSMKKRKRMRIKCLLKENDVLKSVIDIYKSADWGEREMYDMFGIIISGHPYMKRLLMPDDWSGYPLRKSYPLQGDEAAQWYEVDQLFGKEYRDEIGPEIRDSAFIDKEDTRGYARLGREVHFGEPYSDEQSKLGEYQEKKGAFLIKKFKKDKFTILKKRR